MKQIPPKFLWLLGLSLWIFLGTGCKGNTRNSPIKLTGDIEFKEDREYYVKAYLNALQADFVHLRERIEEVEDSEYDDYHLELVVVGSKKYERKPGLTEQTDMARELGGILAHNIDYIQYYEDISIGFLPATEWTGEEVDLNSLDQYFTFPLTTWPNVEYDFSDDDS